MEKLKLIKSALNNAVIIDFEDEKNVKGWLIPSSELKGYYMLLPIEEDGHTHVFQVSSIKHISFLNNGNKLW